MKPNPFLSLNHLTFPSAKAVPSFSFNFLTHIEAEKEKTTLAS